MGKIENINHLPNTVFHEKSVTDKEFMENLLTTENFDFIYHLAAVASVADSVVRPIETHVVNFDSTLIILETLRNMEESRLKRLVFASSAAVYGDEETLPKVEESVIRPLSPYAVDKFASEKFVLAYNNLYHVPTSAVRFFNVFGPNQNPNSPYSGVISIIVDAFERQIRLKEKSEFNLFGDGTQSRDFIYIADVVQALEIVAQSEDSLGNVYNVGTGMETEINDLLTFISEILDEEIIVNMLEERVGDIKKSVGDISQLSSLGFEQHYSVKEGLVEYLKSLELLD